MPILSLSKIRPQLQLKSGNHGSDSSKPNEAASIPGIFSTAPQVSQQTFVPPTTSPVRKAPTIKDLISDPAPVNTENSNNETEAVPEDSNSDAQNLDNVEIEESAQFSSDIESTEPLANTDEKFAEKWTEMFELLFRELPTIYYPLRNTVPLMKENIITVTVNNEMMKENFEARTRLALEYLRNHYSPKINDIQVVVKVDAKPKEKLIYDTQDKMNDLRIQNPDLPEFLDILKFTSKDL